MATENSTPERDVKDFKFQQLCKIRISPSSGEIKTDRLQWLATSSRFGFTFIGEKSGFRVIKTNTILLLDQEHAKDRSSHIIEDFPVWCTVELSAHVSHLALSCDELTLIVAVKECANLILLAYDLRGFANQNAKPLPFQKVKLNASPGSTLLDLAWNPGNPLMLATCVSDGSVELFEIKENLNIVASLPVSTCATCLCWSPKGKQIVIGLKDGSLIQFDQELKAKKKWGCPTVLEGPQQVVDVAWLSTYMFLAAYVPANPQDSDQPVVVLTICSKEGNTQYLNYEDVCYGSGENRKHKYYISFVHQWELAVIASSNATETSVVGKNLDQKTNWEHWTLEDSGRAELPLADSDCDSFPVAMAIDFSSQMQISLGDNKTHPPCPIVLLLSTDGLLVPFHMMYMRPDIANLTQPPEPLPSSGDRTPQGPPAQAITTASTTVKTGLPLPFGQKPFGSAAATATTTSGLSLPFGQKTPALPAAAAATSTAESSLASGQKLPLPLPKAAPIGQTSRQQQSGQVTLNSDSGASSTPSRPGTSTAATAFGQGQTAAAGTTASKFGLPTTGNSFQFVTKPAQQTNQTPNSTVGTSQEFSLKSGQLVTAKSSDQASKPAASTGLSSGTTGFTFSTQPSATKAGQAMSGSGPLFQQTKPQNSQTGSSSVGQSFKFTSQAQSEASAAVTSTQPSGPPASSRVVVPPAVSTIPEPDTVSEPVSTTTPASTEEDGEDAETLRQRTQSANEAIENTFSKSIIEEMTDFMKELKAHKQSVKTGIGHVGTQEEMQKLRRATDEMSHFCNGIKDTTKDQSREVHDLKIMCMDLITMAEECRVRQQRNTDTKYHQLLRSCALDPASAEKLRDLQQQYQLLQQSLQEVDLVLDAQWDEYKRKKASKGRIQTPTRDSIYRVVKSNCNLIEGQKNLVDNLQEQLKCLKLYNRSASWQNTNNSFSSSNSGPDLTLLVESLDEQKPRSSSSLNLSQSVSISPEKQAKLREYLSRRAVPKVKSTVPANLSMSKIVAARGLREALAAAEDAKSNKITLPAPTPSPSRPTSRVVPPTSPTPPQVTQPPKSQAPARQAPQAQPQYTTPTLPKSTGLSLFGPTAFTGQAFFKKLQPSTTSTATLTPSSVTTTVAASASSIMSQQPSTAGFSTVDKAPLPYKTPVPSVVPPPMLQVITDQTTQNGAQYEDVSPANTPDLESEDQEGFTGEDEYEDEEEEYDEDDEDDDDDDEDEVGFGPGYELGSDSVRTTQSDDARRSRPDEDSSLLISQNPPAASEQVSNNPVASKNLFVGGDTSGSGSLGPTKTQTFTFGGSPGSGMESKPLFGSLSSNKDTTTTEAEKSADKSVSGASAGKDAKSSASGFSFLNVSVPSTQSSSGGFSFKTANTSTSGFSFGGDVGIFSSTASGKSEPSKSSSSVVSAFGGGLFGGSSPTTASPADTNVDSTTASSAPGSSFLTPDSNKGVYQPTDTSKSVLTITGSSAENDDRSSASGLVSSTTTTVETSAGATTVTSVTPAQPDSQTTTTSSSAQPSILERLLGRPHATTTGGFGQLPTLGGLLDKTSTTTTAQTTPAPVFGGGDTALGSSSPSSFAALSSSTTSSSSSALTATSASPTSLFGSVSTTASMSIFGGSAAVTTAASGFGAGTSSVFGETSASANSIFGGNTTTTTTTSSMFGGTTATATVFGSNATSSSLFGGNSVSTPSMFGSTPSTTSSVFGAQPAFGSFAVSSPGQGFGTSVSAVTEGSVFGGGGGGLFGGLGGKPSAEKANTNVFGGNQTFGAAGESQSSLFGKNTQTFGSQNASSTVFGSGSFTSGGGSVASSGFGVTQSQPPSGFGDSSTFGGSPAFGATAAFGSKTAFGSSPTFGAFASPSFSNPVGSVFGASSTVSAQGSNFASFAESSSPTFGALAQSSDVPLFGDMAQNNTAFGGGTGFGSTSPAPPAFGAPASPQNTNLSPQFTSYRG
ncbi:nuclear pore complex protein Nup214-like isoform X2 [Gigantopelta aegis]|uniref:nuclear pore complex protein Nup214-like isoform X2 n=1 Tax=Gigantopelta aegis TaxID=1735272 RepID=UPI001B88DAA9|nr:nuclear pore complex protein Nup214-like isoform X2 [Gigantopelta aegis]